MKLVIRTLIFHIFCIIIFAIIYSKLSEQFYVMEEHEKKMLLILYY